VDTPIDTSANTGADIPIDAAVNVHTNTSANADVDTSDLEKQIDELVYGLYGLTEEEVRVVERGK
jgi:hypothetical protein